MFDLAKFIDKKAEWSRRTFGDIEVSGILSHMRKEIAEIERDPTDLIEYIDVIFLALDGASRAGYSGVEIEQAFLDKHAVNLARKWEKTKDGHSEHVRTTLPCDHRFPKSLSVNFDEDGSIWIEAVCTNCCHRREGKLA